VQWCWGLGHCRAFYIMSSNTYESAMAFAVCTKWSDEKGKQTNFGSCRDDDG